MKSKKNSFIRYLNNPGGLPGGGGWIPGGGDNTPPDITIPIVNPITQEEIKTSISQNIVENTNGDITSETLKTILTDIVNCSEAGDETGNLTVNNDLTINNNLNANTATINSNLTVAGEIKCNTINFDNNNSIMIGADNNITISNLTTDQIYTSNISFTDGVYINFNGEDITMNNLFVHVKLQTNELEVYSTCRINYIICSTIEFENGTTLTASDVQQIKDKLNIH